MAVTFTKRRFLNLPLPQRHKKCAEVLRAAYNLLVNNSDASSLMENYENLSIWLQIPSLEKDNNEHLADRYHWHASLGNLHHKEHNLLPQVRVGDKQSAAPAWPISIYLDNIRSAHNVGSILRTVEAFSLGSVHFSTATPFIDNKQVKDASMGSIDWIDCKKSDFNILPKPLIAMETSPQAQNIFEFDFPETFTLVVGNEEYGCSASTLTAADAIVEIPLRGRKNSLNVANAFAIAAAEIYRQRTKEATKLQENYE